MSKAPPVTAGLFYWMQAKVRIAILQPGVQRKKNPPSWDGGFA
jgi:hypothetical protein